MRQGRLLIAAACCLWLGVCNAADDIGLYFDTGGTVSCSNVLYEPLDLYIIASNLAYPNDFGGWELAIASDPQVYVTVGEIYGEAINVGQFPEFMVGLGEPLLPVSGAITLARLFVVATGEGMLHIDPISSPSIPGSSKPAYYTSSVQQITEMNVVVPDENCDCQGHFSSNCEVPFSQQGADFSTYTIPNSSSFYLESGTIRESGSIREPNYDITVAVNDFGFLGTVMDARYECVDGPRGGVKSLAFIEFRISENFYGVLGNKLTVDVKVNRPSHCVEYDQDYFSDFKVGDAYVVFGTRDGVRNRVSRIFLDANGVLQTASGEKVATSNLVDKARMVGEKRLFWNQIRRSDCILLGKVTNINTMDNSVSILIQEVLKGSVKGKRLNFRLNENFDPQKGEIIAKPNLNIGNSYYMSFSKSGSAFELFNGAYSVFEFLDGNLFGYKGIPWGPLELAEKMMGEEK